MQLFSPRPAQCTIGYLSCTSHGKVICWRQGAFSVAQKAKVPVVPITLIGTGRLMPNGQEGRLFWGTGVRIIVHPPLPPETPADVLMDSTRKAIASELPPELVA